MRRNSWICFGGIILSLSSCAVNLLPPLEAPQALSLNISSLEVASEESKFKWIDPVYLSGVFISQPYRSSKIYSCNEDSSLSGSGYEWVGSFESQFESELDRVLRESYPSVRFVSKESGAFSQSELSIKVYQFCLNEGLREREMKLKMLVSLTPYGGKEQITKLLNLSFNDDSSGSISEFLNKGFGSFFGDLSRWLDEK